MKHHKGKFEFVERETERVMQNALMTFALGVSITISDMRGFNTGIRGWATFFFFFPPPQKPSKEFKTCLDWTAPVPAV